MHSWSRARKKTDGSGRLDARGLDASWDAEPIRVDAVPVLNRVVALVEPGVHSVQVVLAEKLCNTRDRAANSPVPELDPVCL